MLSIISWFMILPAILIEIISPIPKSKISSGLVLESIHEITTAIGFCPTEVALIC